jgi:MFS family permease
MPLRNISLLFLIKLSKWFMLYIPISYLYYLENDFGQIEFLTLHAVYSGVIAFLEIPSGYIADVWGRKQALIWGTLFGVFGFMAYAVSAGLLFFLIAEILLGIGQSLISGADSALLYDTLLERKQQQKYIRFEGYITALGNFAEVSAALFVSIIVFSSFRSYFYLQSLVASIGFIAALFLIEPKLHDKKLSGNFKEIIDVVNFIFLKNKKLRNLIVFSSVIGFASLSMAWLTQPLLEAIGIKESHFGYSLAFLNLLVAFGSISAIMISKRFSLTGNLLFIGIPLTLGFFFAGGQISMWSFLPLGIFYFIRGTAHPVLKNYINELTSSEKRATVLSVRSLIIRLLFLIMGPILGVVSEKISLPTGFILCGITVFIPASVFMFFIVKNKRSEKA